MPRLLPALAAAWMAAALVVASATTSSRAAVNAEEEIPTLELKVDDAPVDALDLSPSAARRLANPTSCAGSTVPACAVRTPRAVLFVLDASNSLNPDDFSGPMLNFIQLTYCAFDSRDSNQAGVVTFANQIKTRVPLAVYTQAQWFAQVETIRTQASSICCFCCTPTAEAFDAAAVEFKRANVPAGTQKVAFVISDGTPYQNNGGTYAWNPRGLNEAVYAYTTVPQRAVALRQLGVRLMFVGVPNKLGRLPATDYFAGIPDPAKTVAGQPSNYQCESRNPPKKFCATMNTPPFPIVSFPIADNLISVGSFDVDSLISGTITSLCKLVPTQGPTARPTTLSPTRKPSRAPSKSPTSNSFDHVDLNFLLDRSGSIVTDASACRKSSAADQSLPDDKVCWHLMLSFVKTLVARTLQLGDKGPIGWMGAGPVTRKGVRVNILGFACTDSQRQPVIVKIAEGVSTQAAFDAAVTAAESITPFGGTCPGAALQRVVGLRQFSLNRPFAAAILATDGVFYDGNDPKAAGKALTYLGVAKYAFAVGLPLSKYPGGLRPWQLKEQKVQLNDFVDGDQSNLFNLGEDGYNKINEVAVEIAESLPDKYVGAIGQQLQKYPYVCSGYTNKGRCELQGPSAPGSSGLFCFWDAVNTKCKLKQRCDRPKAACGTSITGIPDPCCSWNANSNVCVAAANRPSYCSVAGLLE